MYLPHTQVWAPYKTPQLPLSSDLGHLPTPHPHPIQPTCSVPSSSHLLLWHLSLAFLLNPYGGQYTWFYGLNCVPTATPNSYVWSSNLQCDGIWKWCLWEIIRSQRRKLFPYSLRPISATLLTSFESLPSSLLSCLGPSEVRFIHYLDSCSSLAGLLASNLVPSKPFFTLHAPTIYLKCNLNFCLPS